jgi:hypothetical protein
MELITSRALECAAAVRPDLRSDAEVAEEAECTPSDGGVGHIEMNGHLATSTEMDTAGRVEETRELRQPVAVAPRGYPGELVAEVFRE